MQIGVENTDSNSVLKMITKQYWTGQMNRREAIEKLNLQLNRLFNKHLEVIFKHGGVIAGGCWVDALLDKKYKDIDVYFPSPEAANNAYNEIYNVNVNPGKSNLRVGKHEFMRFISFPNAEEVIKSFDLSCVKIAYDGQMWYFGEHTLEDINNLYLRLEQVNCPIAVQTARLTKYMDKGFIPDVHTFAAMCKHIKQGGDQVKTQYEEYPKDTVPVMGAHGHVVLDDLAAMFFNDVLGNARGV